VHLFRATFPNKENKWQGFNLSRYVNQDYDSAIAAANAEIDPFKRASLFIKANDLLWQDTVPESGCKLQHAAHGA
jgi:peptide/nickel transport system substrate-binding protein